MTAVAPAVATEQAGPMLEARDLRLSFGETPALRGANVSIAAGELLAVMGPSGSGKSTLLNGLLDLGGME